MLGSNPLVGNILCSPSPLEETINRGPNTPIPTKQVCILICEEIKDPDILSVIVGVDRMSVTEQITTMHENQTR